MGRKLFVKLSCFLVFMCVFTGITETYASENQNNTNIGIIFEKEKEVDIPTIKPPLIDGGNEKPPLSMLPKTGELLTSMIIILMGISLFIFGIGIIVIKQLYKEASWEGI